MRTNQKQKAVVHTHEGAPARIIGAYEALRRSVCACLLWEDGFYETGEDIATRITGLVKHVDARKVAQLAIEAREDYKLRHVPLLLVRELARSSQPEKLVSKTLARVIQRADELAEFIAIYWREGKQPLSKQVKRGLAWAMHKFSEYELAKYDRDHAVRPRDVMFLAHPKPKDEAEAALWKKLANKELATPDTWEVQLSAGADKKETFERLLREGKLGYLALIRNLRNMIESKVDSKLVREAIVARRGGAERVLPFRFIAAAKHAKMYEAELDQAMQASLAGLPKLPGLTVLLVDNSGSMQSALSKKSEMSAIDAACGIAIVARGVAEHCRVFTFSNHCTEIPPRQGMALRDEIQRSMVPAGTMLGAAVAVVNKLGADRIIVITDEQSHDVVPNPKGTGYVINVQANQNGVGYGPWVHIDGFSEATVRYIAELEHVNAQEQTQ